MWLLRETFIYKLPWKQVCQKVVLIPLLLPLLLYALYTVPEMTLNAYNHGVRDHLSTFDALLHAGTALALGTFLFSFMALELVFTAACFWQLVLWAGMLIAALPAIWSGLCTAAITSWQFLRKLPSTAYNSTAKERFAFVCICGCLALLGVIAYFGWGPASYVWGKIAFSDSSATENFLLTLMLDLVGSTLVWSFVVQLFLPVIRLIAGRWDTNNN